MSSTKDIEPIKQELEKKYQAVGKCSLESDRDSILKLTDDLVDESARYVVESWESLPDLIGRVHIERPLPISEEMTAVVRVVDGAPELTDIYTLKRYSEVLSPSYSFLISKQPFNDQTRAYLENHPHILRFLTKASSTLSAAVPIIVMTWGGPGNLSIDSDLVSDDPFDSEHMW